MQKVLTPAQMRDLERRYMDECRISSLSLMERAATGVVRTMQSLGGIEGRIAIFACGPGGNGGDGFAAARLYADKLGKAIVVPLCDEDALTGDARTNCIKARATPNVAFASIEELDRLPCPGIWVDALFGIGLSRPLDGPCIALIQRMAEDRAQGARVLAVDIASGLDALTGRLPSFAVAATDTVTFECAKPGHLLEDGIECTGTLHVCSIGIPESLLPPDAMAHAALSDLSAHIRPRARNSHKGTYGHLLVVAGSRGMAGAAVLTAQGALRSGVGLVTVACPESIVPIVQTCAPCAMCVPLPERDGAIAAEAVDVLARALEGKRAVAIGPGLSGRAAPDVLHTVLMCALPAVIDADALNILARHPQLCALLAPRHVLTPHPGEAWRLLGAASTSPIEGACAIRALNCTAVYKGAASVIAGDGITIRTAGCAGLAKGGSGDVLTGALGALLAQGYPPEQAAWMASVAHGAAGERAADAFGEMGMTAEDVAMCLAQVWRDA